MVLGKHPQIRLALACLFARGHLLIEDLPGIGKTTLAKVLAKSLGLKFQRMQFTSDLLPGDILGMSVFDQHAATFTFHPGPIFTQVFLVDEINRTTPKSQSALLEAMEEQQVTIEGETRALEAPFFVIATQNPMEQAGTFALPESQMDRFLMRIHLGYPDRDAEKQILKGIGAEPAMTELTPFLDAGRVLAIQNAVDQVHVSDTFLAYLQDILAFTRTSGEFQVGLSPGPVFPYPGRPVPGRICTAVTTPCLKTSNQMLPWVAGHRLKSGRDGFEFSRDRLMDLLKTVPVPV